MVLGGGSWTFTLLLYQAFLNVLPYLTEVWVLTIILDIILLRRGIWNTLTRMISIGLKVIGMLITVSLLVDTSLIDLSAASLAAAGFSMSADTTGIMIFSHSQFVWLVLLLAICLGGVEIIKTIIRIFEPPIPGMLRGK